MKLALGWSGLWAAVLVLVFLALPGWDTETEGLEIFSGREVFAFIVFLTGTVWLIGVVVLLIRAETVAEHRQNSGTRLAARLDAAVGVSDSRGGRAGAVMRSVVPAWAIVSCAELVTGQFFPHTQGVTSWRSGPSLFDPTEYEYGSLTGWQYGPSPLTAFMAVAAGLCVVGYLGLRRRLFLMLAVGLAGVATLGEFAGLAALPETFCGGWFEPTCESVPDAVREAAWGQYFTLGAALSLTLACVAALVLAPRRDG